MDKLFQLYKRLLELHIGTKTNDLVFHQASEGFYDLGFEVFHAISEKKQDIGEETPIDCKMARNEAYDILEEMKSAIEVMIKEKNTYGMDNLLRGLIDKIEFSCGTAKGLADEEKEEEGEEDMEEPKSKGLPKK